MFVLLKEVVFLFRVFYNDRTDDGIFLSFNPTSCSLFFTCGHSRFQNFDIPLPFLIYLHSEGVR